MEENWYALLVAIVSDLSAEKAIRMFFGSAPNVESNEAVPKKERKSHRKFGAEEIERMIELKGTMSYKAVGKIFDTPDWNVYTHIKNYKPELIHSEKMRSKVVRKPTLF